MKIVTLGNKQDRYALIIMKCNPKTKESVDNTITYYYSNSLKELSKTETTLCEISFDKPYYMDTKIYDYKEMHYVRNY